MKNNKNNKIRISQTTNFKLHKLDPSKSDEIYTHALDTKYEKTKILGQRTKQLNSGCHPYIDVPKNIIDSYLIAEMELKQKKIPVIIRRPISVNRSEYLKLEDLEQIY